jgi:hypothetical protein
VIGDVIGGLLLGPSLLVRLAPEAQAYLLPAAAAPMLNVVFDDWLSPPPVGVISPRIFTMLVIMAVVTTMMTSPVLARIHRGNRGLDSKEPGFRMRAGRGTMAD